MALVTMVSMLTAFARKLLEVQQAVSVGGTL